MANGKRWWNDGNRGGWFRLWSDLFTLGASELLWSQLDKEAKVQDIIDVYDPNADGSDPYQLQQEVLKASEGYGGATGEQEKYIDSLIAQYERDQANKQQEYMRDTSILSSASQLAQLGLSPSGVLQVGGASSGVSSSMAHNPQENISQSKYEQQQANTRSVLSMIKSMASSGIYGSAYSKARGLAQKMASQTASSAIQANGEAEIMGQMAKLNKDELLNQIDVLNSQNHNYLG